MHKNMAEGLWCFSFDPEVFGDDNGFFDTKEEAIQAGRHVAKELGYSALYVGKVNTILTDEIVAQAFIRSADDADEHLAMQDEWCWCEGTLVGSASIEKIARELSEARRANDLFGKLAVGYSRLEAQLASEKESRMKLQADLDKATKDLQAVRDRLRTANRAIADAREILLEDGPRKDAEPEASRVVTYQTTDTGHTTRTITRWTIRTKGTQHLRLHLTNNCCWVPDSEKAESFSSEENAKRRLQALIDCGDLPDEPHYTVGSITTLDHLYGCDLAKPDQKDATVTHVMEDDEDCGLDSITPQMVADGQKAVEEGRWVTLDDLRKELKKRDELMVELANAAATSCSEYLDYRKLGTVADKIKKVRDDG